MFERIDQWLVNHNFNPVFNKELSVDRSQERKTKLQKVNDGINSSVAIFRTAQEELAEALENIEEAKQDAAQSIEHFCSEIETEEKVISTLETQETKTKRIKSNIDTIIGEDLSDTPAGDDFVDPIER